MRARWLLVPLGVLIASAACSSDDDGGGTSTNADGGTDSSSSSSSGNPVAQCNAVELCPCIDGTNGAAGCNGLTCDQACADHGGKCPTFDGCTPNDAGADASSDASNDH